MAESLKAVWPGWETIRLIGQGSFGAVYEIQRKIQGKVESAALKVISIPQSESEITDLRAEGYDDESLTQYFTDGLHRIENEYVMMTNMKGHANVVYCDDIMNVQQENGFGWNIFIKMELLYPLKTYFGNGANEEQVIKLGMDICNALMMCEKLEVVHRDIKPENIFVSRRDGNFKLGDFGIAKTMEHTTGGSTVGTYDYMAPEVFNNQPYHHEADIYSLGLVMYWLLNERTGPFLEISAQRPTPSKKQEARMRRFSGEAIPEPLNGCKELKEIVLKACAHSPQDRFRTAREMYDALATLRLGFMPDDEKTIPLFLRPNVGNDTPVVSTPSKIDNEVPGGEKGSIGARKEEVNSVPSGIAESETGRKRLGLFIAGGAAILILLLLVGGIGLKGLRKGDQGSSANGGQTGGNNIVVYESEEEENISDESVTEENEASDEVVESGTSVEEFPPEEYEWCEWSDEKPTHLAEGEYDIETRILYRSRQKEKTTSKTKDNMDGWELYGDSEQDGGFGNWSGWSLNAVSASENREVETQTRYRYADKVITSGAQSQMTGWTLYNTTYTWGDYGAWSDWSTSAVSNSDSRKVETKEQYRYRTLQTTQVYTDWVAGDWVDAEQATGDLCQLIGSRTIYPYYYFYCTACGRGWRYPYHGIACENCKQKTVTLQTGTVEWFENPWSDSIYWGSNKYYQYIGGNIWWNWADGAPKNQWRYQTRSVQNVSSWSAWSSYSDSAVSATSSREVNTRTLYRYCERTQIPTYHFYQWGNWSEWSATAVAQSDSRQVETATYYRYRDKVKEKLYHFYRWGEWSDWQTDEVVENEDLELETKEQYRYKRKKFENDDAIG